MLAGLTLGGSVGRVQGMETIFTVNAATLLADAASIEAHANDSLPTWIILGKTDKHAEAMRKARALRDAAAADTVAMRRAILRNAGFIVKTPRHAGR